MDDRDQIAITVSLAGLIPLFYVFFFVRVTVSVLEAKVLSFKTKPTPAYVFFLQTNLPESRSF